MGALGDERGRPDPSRRQKTIGRYALHGSISAGGVAAVHYGRLLGRAGFTRTVAIKRLHAAFAKDPALVAMFVDEARLASRIHHPNVVGTLDVLEDEGELFIVMDYVAGLSLSALVREAAARREALPPAHAAAIAVGVLHGLHAAHEARSAAGEPLSIVHRDVSPQNVLVGEDGVPRVIDFGVAKAAERVHVTSDHEALRGKVVYMAPEHLARAPVDRRADVYSSSVVLWEALAARRYVEVPGGTAAALLRAVKERRPEPPSAVAPGVPRALDEVVLRGLARDPGQRFATALEMAAAIEAAIAPSTQREIAEWVGRVAGETLRERAEILRRIETASSDEGEGEARADAGAPPARVSIPAPAPEIATAEVWTEARRPPRRIDCRPIALVAGLATVLLAWFLGTRSRTEPAPRASASGPGLVVTSTVPQAVSAEGSQRPFGLPAAPARGPQAAPPVTTASVAPSVAAVTPVAPASAAPAPAPTHAPRPSHASHSCKPPYTLDHGIRVPKPECL